MSDLNAPDGSDAAKAVGRRIIVCGGRNYRNERAVYGKLDALHTERKIDLIIQGGATGADHLAQIWALENSVSYITFKPDWNSYGRAAGPMRNRQMLIDGRPDLVVAFPGKKGTRDMCWQAEEFGVPVERVAAECSGCLDVTKDHPNV